MFNPGSLIYALVRGLGGITYFGAWYLWLLIGGTLLAAAWRAGQEWRVRADVISLTKRLRKLGQDVPRQEVEQWFVHHRKSALRPAWDQYRQALRYEDGNDSKPDPTHFFSDHAIVFDMANHRATEVMPGLLTMAGILGTFLGLVAGLHGLNPNAPNGLGSGIGQLIGGLSLKFTSSVYGILGALFWTVADRLIWSPRFYQAVWALQDELDVKFGVPTAEFLLQEIRTIQGDQKESLATLVTDVIIPQLVGGISESIRATIVPGLHELAEQQHLTTESLKSNGQEMARVAESTSQTQMAELDRIAQNLINEMSGQTVELARTLHGALQETVTTQEELTGTFRQLLEESEPMFTALRETAAIQRQAFAEGQAIHQALVDSAGFWDQFHAAMRETIQGAESRLREFFEEAERRSGSMAAQFESVGQTLVTQLESVLSATSDLGQIFAEERKMMGTHFAAFEATQSEYLTQVQETVRTLPGLVDALAASATDVQHHATESFTTWQENISRDLSRLSETLLGQVGVELDQFNTIQGQMSVQFESATDRFEEMSERLIHSAATLRGAAEDALERLEQNLSSGLTLTFQKFDEELGSAVGHLAEGVHQLEGAVGAIGSPAHHLGESSELLQREAERFVRSLQQVSRFVSRNPIGLESE